MEKSGNSIFVVSEANDALIREATLAARQPTMSLGVNLDTDEELKRAYELLSQEDL